eukprot:COSAG05_NODE_205_length_14184_cov_81.700887_9_plen_384_part_00
MASTLRALLLRWCVVAVLALPLAMSADKRYGVDTGMKIHGKQGKQEDSPKVDFAAKAIRCRVCATLVEDLWNKTSGIDYDPGEDGRIVTTEDGVLGLIEDTCRGRAPLFTQQHEVVELTGATDPEQMSFEFREAFDGPSDWPEHVPKPLARINWATVAMKKACSSVVDEMEVEIATLIYLGVNAPTSSNIDMHAVSDEICVTTTKACAEEQRRSTKVRTSTEFAHAAKGSRRQPNNTSDQLQPLLQGAERNRVEREQRASKANRAARAVRCDMCMLLVEDLWAKALGLGSEGKPMATEDQIFDMIDKTCGHGGKPVPFRGVFELLEVPSSSAAPPSDTEGSEGSEVVADFSLVRASTPACSWYHVSCVMQYKVRHGAHAAQAE